jgi:signal transduction histidine kinase
LLIGPLKDSRGKIVGVLKLENRLGSGKGQRFTPFQVDMHKTFASHIGTAFERARFFERLDKDALLEARKALSYDLHDISNLVHGALIMRLEIAREELACDSFSEVGVELGNISKAAQAVHSLLRWITYGLRGDDVLREKGLTQALEHIANLLKLPVDETSVVGRETLPLDVEYALYKIGLEALFNSSKHGGDNIKVKIRLAKDKGKYTLEIENNGWGFDPAPALKDQYSFGLNSMDRWAQSVGAEVKVLSKPGPRAGTIISVNGVVQPK